MLPTTVRTERLLLRPWKPEDARTLGPILESDAARLAPWLPARVAAPAPAEVLAERLAGWAADFDAGRAFRYALRSPDDAGLLGGADLHPRSATARVPLTEADRIEIGYWLAAGAEGKGLALEAVRALVKLALTLPGIASVEARVDPRNERSAALVRRLAFVESGSERGITIWLGPGTVGLHESTPLR
jgi:RimJ/RimL family protein N-acetyltransferase